jgi:hypothetical protein
MQVSTNEKRLIRSCSGKFPIFSDRLRQFGEFGGLEAAPPSEPEIEEAVVSDRFLLAVAMHRKVRGEELLLLRGSLLRGSLLRSLLCSFLLCHRSTPYMGIG